MKGKNILMAIVLFTMVNILFTSCYRRDNNDEANGYNNNNNNNKGNGYGYIYDEEFNGADNNNWTFASTTDSTFALISNGSYQFVDYSTSFYPTSVIYTNANTSGNFTVQTKIESNNMMGLVFGTSTIDNGYAFYIDSNGYFSLYKEGINTVPSTIIIPSTEDTLYAIKKGWNQLEVDQINGNWTGYINGTQVFSLAARPISGAGFGFKIVPATIGYADFLIVKNN